MEMHMATPQDQLTELSNRSQEAVAAAVRGWAETVRNVTYGSAIPANLPKLNEVVDGAYDFGRELLANQRELAKAMLAAYAENAETVRNDAREATSSVINYTVQAAEAVTDQAVHAANAVTEQAAEAGRSVQDHVAKGARSGKGSAKR